MDIVILNQLRSRFLTCETHFSLDI